MLVSVITASDSVLAASYAARVLAVVPNNVIDVLPGLKLTLYADICGHPSRKYHCYQCRPQTIENILRSKLAFQTASMRHNSSSFAGILSGAAAVLTGSTLTFGDLLDVDHAPFLRVPFEAS